MARPFGFYGWDLPIALAMAVAATAAVTLLVLGVVMVANGDAQVAAYNEFAQQQNSKGCGDWTNGTAPPSCAPLAGCEIPDDECPGQRLADLGGMISLESLIPLGSMGALVLAQFVRWTRVPP
ncbi:MAG TPA: hypothetical protein VGP88_08510 [Thermoplasmata archaeon]|jgi:hypothetical protein|nr:hypothetical protein [Thermoplasmata archaeon]